jgi:hypothetical protein
MGGRDTPDGQIDYVSFDHTDANVNNLATLNARITAGVSGRSSTTTPRASRQHCFKLMN